MNTFHQPPNEEFLDQVRALPVHSAISDWYLEFVRQGGGVGKGIDHIIVTAATKARQYREMGTCYDDFQPGNGTSYKLVLHDLVAPYVRLMVEKQAEAGDESFLIQLKRYINEGWTEADLWRYAFDHTMAGRAGGELLVALPENGGRCAVVSVQEDALLVPDYVGGLLGMQWGDVLPLAAYLTIFVNVVALQRRVLPL